jgi:V8-like Glu-specific endopeptidase
MLDTQKLEKLSVEELLAELRAREAKLSANTAVVDSEPSEELREFDSKTLVKALKDNQKVIYGTDDRLDIFQINDRSILSDADSVVALFTASDVTDNGNGTSNLRTQNFGVSNNLCPGERFREQPVGAFCSGFLVAPDIIATAGHCVKQDNVTTMRFVFGFRMLNASTAQTVLSNAEIYRGVSVIGRQEVGNGADWALVRIDRSVPNHRIAQIRRTGKIADNQAVHVIGHPVGLPMKVAGKAAVRSNASNAFFVANLDTYGGNSGSPVFNSNTHEVEGVLVRGETDFVQQGSCNVSLVCPATGCRGEDCTRTTEFGNLVNSQFANWQQLDNNAASVAIIADGNNLYQLHKTGLIWKYTGTPFTGWQELDNNPATKQIVAAGGQLYQIHNTGAIWKYVGPAMTGWQQLDNNAASVAIIADGNNLYQLHKTGLIWKYTGTPFTGWQELDNNPATKQIVAAGGQLYQIHNTGAIWKYVGPAMTGWQQLDNNAASVAIIADGNNLYQLHKTGLIWKYTGTPFTGWQELDNNPATKQIVAAGGQLYQIHNTGAIWKYVGPPMTGWQQLDNNAASVAIAAAASNLYQLHKNGNIWRYNG